MIEVLTGTTATFYCTYTRVSGEQVDPIDPVMSIYQDDNLIYGPVAMTKISVGYYFATWAVPNSQPSGNYSAFYEGVVDGLDGQAEEPFTVVSSGSPGPIATGFYCSWDDVKTNLLGLDVSDMCANLETVISGAVIQNIKVEIDTYCKQNFDRTNITEFYDGTGTNKIVLKRRPIYQLYNCVLRVIPSISWYTFRRWRHINVVDSQGIQVGYQQGGPEPINSTVMPPYNPGDYTWETDIVKADLFVDCANGLLTIPPRILYLEMNAIPFWNYTFLRGNANIEVNYDYGYSLSNMPRDLRNASALLVACQVLRIKGMGLSAGTVSMNFADVSRNFGSMPYAGAIEDMRKQAYQILDHFRRISVG